MVALSLAATVAVAWARSVGPLFVGSHWEDNHWEDSRLEDSHSAFHLDRDLSSDPPTAPLLWVVLFSLLSAAEELLGPVEVARLVVA